ncbi:hypothetical protein EX895_001176 [Sporisorium graminicola]|uniref:Uncharacterized protein n=1 Tax=Sporisorium graminicola TaxID=280036 RepID=A0A4V6EUJ1_9BASI|nr:hypothetical protein EX895_001176 [Sporisorium graminicola]TKY89879.1 hypothetical protein EX895_001176 [Sporisorium graminicola]
MSIQQGLISPPLSGRAYKADPPRVQDIHKAVNTADVFGHAPSASSSAHYAKPTGHLGHDHTIRSPVKKHKHGLSDADRAQRPLTPPMSKDVRHDQHESEHDGQDGHFRTDSEGDLLNAPASSSSYNTVKAANTRDQRASLPVTTSRRGLMAAASIRNRFDTLTKGLECESDDEHNPFLDRRPPTTSTKSESHAHHSHPYYDNFDSDQDAEGSVDGDALDRTAEHDVTPRASTSSSTATTPPRAPRHALAYRPARPFSERVRVDNEAVTGTMPIRDTPKNPFLAGGPADNGFHGPNRHAAYRRAQQIPGKERGKIAYVFRGQRVTYADPEYDSDDDDSELDEQYAKTNQFNPHHNPERPPRLQPRLLFPPPNASTSQPQAPGSKQSSAVQMEGRHGQTHTAYLPGAVEVVEDEFGGATSSSSYDDDTSHAPRTGGGLFVAQIAAQREQQLAAQGPTSSSRSSQSSDSFHSDQHSTGQQAARAPVYQAHALDAREHGEMMAPSSSTRLQSITRDSGAVGKGADGQQAARDALLARLNQTDWSDDDEDDERCNGSNERVRQGSQSRRAAADEEQEEQRVQTTHSLSRSQSHRKRMSEHEQQPGQHAGEEDGLARPMKRSRASYAY